MLHRKRPRRFYIAATILLLLGTCCVVLWQSTQRTPAWYDATLSKSSEQTQSNGRELERRLVSLSNDIRLGQSWSAVLPAHWINGWLASDLPEKFPNALPDSIREPRVNISDQTLDVAFQLSSTAWAGTVVIRMGIQSTDRPNQIAFQIHSVRSGMIQLPISWWADPLTESLQQQDILLEWTDSEGLPTALLTLPHDLTTSADRHSKLTQVQLQGDSIAVAGLTRHLNQTAEIQAERR